MYTAVKWKIKPVDLWSFSPRYIPLPVAGMFSEFYDKKVVITISLLLQLPLHVPLRFWRHYLLCTLQSAKALKPWLLRRKCFSVCVSIRNSFFAVLCVCVCVGLSPNSNTDVNNIHTSSPTSVKLGMNIMPLQTSLSWYILTPCPEIPMRNCEVGVTLAPFNVYGYRYLNIVQL